MRNSKKAGTKEMILISYINLYQLNFELLLNSLNIIHIKNLLRFLVKYSTIRIIITKFAKKYRYV